jgi:hypothetical protein
MFDMHYNGNPLYEIDQGSRYTLVYVGDENELGWHIQVTFSKVKDFPEMIRIRATNWRCEDEPNGLYAITDARRFYRELLEAGLELQGEAVS